jgi:hypothetical protein
LSVAANDASTVYEVGTATRAGRESLAAALTGGVEGAGELIGGTERMHFFFQQLDDIRTQGLDLNRLGRSGVLCGKKKHSRAEHNPSRRNSISHSALVLSTGLRPVYRDR